MMALADYIVKKNVPQGENPSLPVFRSRIGMAQGWISIVANILLFGMKLFFGLISNSISLIADSFHTLSDVASSAVVVFGFRMAAKPADKEHPFGHGRAETIAALTIAILIGFAGFEFLKTSIDRLINQEPIQITQVLFVIILITIIMKEILARLSYSLGKTISSDTLKADAIHHRSDMFSSLLVLIAFTGVWLGYPILDAIMGLGVAGLMLYSAYGVAKNAINDLLGKPMDQQMVQDIQSIALKVEGVLNVHDIIVHSYGAHQFISLHIEIPEGESPEHMHQIADAVEKLLTDAMAADVVTHVDPVTVGGKEFARIQKIIVKNLQSMQLDTAIQDLRVVKNQDVESILFQVPVSIESEQKEKFKTQCSQELKQVYPGCQVIIEFKSPISMR